MFDVSPAVDGNREGSNSPRREFPKGDHLAIESVGKLPKLKGDFQGAQLFKLVFEVVFEAC